MLVRLAVEEPELKHLLVNNSEDMDAMLLQFPSFLGEPEQSRMMQEEIEALWQGDDTGVTAASESIIAVAVTD